MNRDQWLRVKGIVADALAQPDADRAAFAAARCGDDAALYEEVRSLLESAAEAAQLYETPRVTTAGLLAAIADGDEAGQVVGGRIGAYRILAEIGRGGMGAAYLAARADEAYEKRVAVKLIKRGMDTDAILRRFRHERQILANLEHPNIVMLLDGGTTQDGLPYFVMEYIDGVPIDEFCEAGHLSIADRLKLFQAVCAAVHHAHEQRVLHRDLKPSNILVTSSGVPKLLDFGIAKLLDSDQGSHTVEPTLLARAMTPQYASPEQMRGEPLSPSSDVYSLGVLLYVLLAGRHPYRLDGRSPQDAERVVCEEVPAKPSVAAAATGGSQDEPEPGHRRRMLSGRLDAIALTALSKHPAARYPSAKALGDDIQRHLDGLPVAARAPRGGPLAWLSAGGRRRSLAVASAIAALVAIVFAGATRFNRTAPPAVESQSVAVLPFTNVDGDPELDYLSDGITEDIINRLSRAPHLRVIARDSANRYRGHGVDLQQVARELRVESILTGRVVQRGTSVSVTAELVDAREQRQIWGERYERESGDLQSLQSTLAQQIATTLQLRFTDNERTRFARSYTQDAEAYQAYLRGRFFWNKRTASGFRTSLGYFKQAVERDPDFALAYSGLADSYGLLTEYHALPATQTYPEVKRAVTKALELDPDLPEAHISKAYLSQFYEWDWAAAEREYKRALELNPNYATGHQWYAEYLAAMGRHQEALASIKRAQAVDPLSLIVNAVEANILYMGGEYDRAIAKAHEVIAMEPNFPEVYEYLKRSHDQKGEYREAIAARQMRRKLLGRDVTETPALRAAAAATTAREYWQHRLEQEILESKTEGRQPFEFAELMTQTGDKQRGLEWLERACVEHDFMMIYVRVAPNLRALRSEPRYQDVLERGCRVQG